MKKYLIIGNGVAGTTAAGEIRKNDAQGEITIITEESIPFYSRIKLPDYIAEGADESDLIIRKADWYTERRINLKTETVINRIDHDAGKAEDESGNVFTYDMILIATGSTAFVPPVDGSDLKKVFALRTFEDARNIAEAAASGGNAVAIGGGLLGLEAAHALIKKGMDLTVIEFFDRLLPRQLDNDGALLLMEMLGEIGFNFRLGTKAQQIQGGPAATGVQIQSGEILPADLVLFSAGVRSNLVLPEALGLETDRGVIVDDHMETSIKGIYAAGDVAQFQGTNYCIWPEAMEQGRIAGINMAGGTAAFTPIPPSNRLKVAGIDLASAGEIDPENKLESDVEKGDGVYKKIVKKDGALAGCIMLGDTTEFSDIVRQINYHPQSG